MKKLDVVIISHNQKESIKKMFSSLSLYKFDKVVFVLDRCYDGTKRFLKSKGAYYVTAPWFCFGRRTSSLRNLGLEHCSDDADVIFLDGDRFPVAGNLLSLRKKRNDVLLFPVVDDTRNLNEPYSKKEGKVENNFYSCGLFMRRSAIDKIVEFQGELFPKFLEKGWGCEDLYMGDLCYHLGLSIDYYKGIVLNGSFENKFVDYDMFIKRMKAREKLNVKW